MKRLLGISGQRCSFKTGEARYKALNAGTVAKDDHFPFEGSGSERSRMKTESVVIETQLDMRDLAALINEKLSAMRAELQEISASSNPLDLIENERPEVAVVGTGRTLRALRR